MEKEETQNLGKKDLNINEETDSKNLEKKQKNDVEKEINPDEEILNLKDKIARAYAEMENQRRRYEKEKDDAFEYGGFSFAKETLNLLDNLERSRSSLESDETLKGTEALNKLIEHLNIITKDMLTIFKKNNIEPIIALNQKLDPNIHQAMMEIEDDAKEIGTIVQEIQKGFMMKDRLLRPSLVGVSKKKIENDSKEDIKDKENQEKKD